MERVFKFKNNNTNAFSKLRFIGKWYLNYSNETVYVNIALKFKELEAHEFYEELV